MATYTYSRLERVVWAEPAAQVLMREVEQLGSQRVFLIVSRTLSTTSAAVNDITEMLGARFAGLFDGIAAHVPRNAVLRAAAAASAAHADLVVAIGGGTVVDGAKMVLLAMACGLREPGDFDTLPQLLANGVPGKIGVRQIAIPTTLSAAEFGSGAGSTDPVRHIKHVIRHPDLVPLCVVLDPAITLHTPQNLWLSTGIRAVDHAVETLCSIAANPFTDAAAAQAVRLLKAGLMASHADPTDLAARTQCQIGAWLSMTAVPGGIPLGASHAIGHVLGGAFGVPHGYTSCVMLPAVLRSNADAAPAGQHAVSEALGRPELSAGDAVAELVAALGLPSSLSQVGITPANFDTIAEQTLLERWSGTNPVPLKTRTDVVAILDRAL